VLETMVIEIFLLQMVGVLLIDYDFLYKFDGCDKHLFKFLFFQFLANMAIKTICLSMILVIYDNMINESNHIL
jgi:hypothetical protein